jgi:DUF2075 family protein
VLRREPYGWAGRVDEFLGTPDLKVVSAVEQHLAHLLGIPPSSSQRAAWKEEFDLLRTALREVAIGRPEAVQWGLALEYELHLEGGRRPDAVINTGTQVFVLEFKQSGASSPAALDQVVGYARDLAEYHKASHDLEVVPVLVLTQAGRIADGPSDVRVIAPRQLPALLAQDGGPRVDFAFTDWLEAPYEPLPTLVEAARMIFNHESLPQIRRAESSGIPEAVALLNRLAKEAEGESQRLLALLAGVPGAGKTLTGLQLVYDRQADAQDATFLSGNGPLVQVLRDALKSKTFVQDLHAFVKTYGRSTRQPAHHSVVFDEAQRAWDAGYMEHNGQGDRSEPEVLIEVGERLDDWCALVGLVGDGQEIHSGEEAGIAQWDRALATGSMSWRVCTPPRLAPSFTTSSVETFEELDLDRSLRSRRAEDLHEWVAALLDGDLMAASLLAANIKAAAFSMYVTRNLADAKAFLVERYADDESARYGILASSKSQRFLQPFGVDSSWPSTKRVKYGPWYNEPRGELGSGCNLEDVVTEFGCQGLELDFPLVAWSDDMLWSSSAWRVKTGRPRYRQDDPVQLRLNSYRVLLTRGRDGFVLFVPPDPCLDETAHALLAAGASVLPTNGQADG